MARQAQVAAHAGGVLHHGARGRSPKRLRRRLRTGGADPRGPLGTAVAATWVSCGGGAFGMVWLRTVALRAGGWNRVWNWKWTCMHTLSPALAGRRRRRVRGSGGRGAGGVPGGAGGAGASGRVLEIEADCGVPAGMSPAMVALLLTLVDVDTPLWLPAGVDDEVRAFLRFHCGCSMVDQPGEARSRPCRADIRRLPCPCSIRGSCVSGSVGHAADRGDGPGARPCADAVRSRHPGPRRLACRRTGGRILA